MLRTARPNDVPVILELIKELARYEREPNIVDATEAMLADALFGPDAVAAAELAIHGDGQVAGFALWYRTYSTWTGRPGIYLEDLFVREERRQHGYGKALLRRLAEIAVEREYTRVEWSVLDWNTPSIDFYRALGAGPTEGWTRFRLEGPALAALSRRR